MIFKTITDEATGNTKVINGLLEDIKRIKTIGFKNFLNLSEIDIDLIDQFNREIQETSDKQAVLTKFTQGTNKATADLIKSSNGMVISEKAKQVAINNTTISAKAGQIALKGLAMAGNMIVFTLISKGIELAATAISNYINRMEIAKEKTEEAISTYESITSEVDSLSTSIEESQKQIDGLNSITNEEDIKNLEIEKGLLEAELAILKEKQAIAKQESHDSAVDSLNTTTTSRYVAPTTTTQFIAGEAVTTTNLAETTQRQELEYAMQAYRDCAKQIEELNAKQKELKESGKENSAEYRNNAETIKRLGTEMKDARSHANELAVSLQFQAKGLDTNITEGEQLYNSIDKTLDDYILFTNAVETNTDALNENSEAKQENANKTEILSAKQQKNLSIKKFIGLAFLCTNFKIFAPI